MSEQEAQKDESKITTPVADREQQADDEATKREGKGAKTGAIPRPTVVDISKSVTSDLVTNMEGLVLSPDSSDDNICKSDWLKARDSLENLLYTKADKSGTEIFNSKSTSCTKSKGKSLQKESPHSECTLGTVKKTTNSVSKVLSWDPWDKLGRKNKKETKRRKFEKTPQQSKENSRPTSPQNQKDHKAGDEPATSSDSQTYLNYEYQPFQPKNTRSVEFTNKVMVVYIKDEKVIGETTEPLKKELEQQIRNKEMRKGHVPDIAFGKKKVMCDWLKK